MPLTVIAANQAKPKEKPYKLFDGGGLFLRFRVKASDGDGSGIDPTRARNGIQAKAAIGSLPYVTATGRLAVWRHR